VFVNGLLAFGLHNAVFVAFLSLLVWGVTRIWKNPPAAHLMWLLVLVKLVTPPLLPVDLEKWSWRPGANVSRSVVVPPIAAPIPSAPELTADDVSSHSAADAVPASSAGHNAQSALPTQPRITLMGTWHAIRPLLMWIWLGGAALLSVLAVLRIVRFQRMLAGTLPASQRIRTVADQLASRMGLRRSPDIRVVDSAVAPLVWCVGGRATVVLPLRLLSALDEQQAAMVLAHELAHLRRGDHWVRMLELAVSVLYWWHPLVWLVRRQLHAAEEQCCDAWVTWVYPDRTHDYAQSLLQAAELLPTHSPFLALTSPFLTTHTVKTRIELVLENRSPRIASRSAFVCLALLAAAVIPAGVRGLEDDDPPQAASAKVETKVAIKPRATQEKPADGAQNVQKEQPAAAAHQPVPKELKLLQGTFKPERWQSDKWPAKPEEFQTWQWTMRGQEINWIRPKQETIRLSFTIDATKSLPEIDLTFLNGPDKGEKCQGVYLASRHKIDLWFQEPGAKGDRPKAAGDALVRGQTFVRFVPAEVLPVADELQALQGTWKFEIYYSDWWPERISDPPISWSKWRWTIKGNEVTWTGMKVPDVKLSFTIDPSKSPRQIDMTFLDGPHKGKKLLGMYEFYYAEDGCHICFADPDAKVDRPTENSYSTNEGRTMVSIEKVPPEKPAAAPAPPAEGKVKDRDPEIDAAIARLRKQGAMVREFHPRSHPEHWVQVTSNNFDDENLEDVEIISRGVPLYFHLDHSSVTPAGLIRLASASRINQLELSGDNIDDALLKSLPKLPLQGQLGLYSDKLTDAGIRAVADCRKLTAITLDGKQLTNACLEHLTGLPELQRVALGKNFTRGAFDVLSRLESLTILDVTELKPELSDLKKVPKLKTLSLSGKKYDDEAARTIADTFKSLDSVYLRHTSITNAGVEHLSRIKTLKILTLDDSLVDDGMAESIRKMKQLTWLSLEHCAIGDDTLAALSECPDMWYVFLVQTQVTDKGLANLPKLKKPLSLYLAHCKSVTDDGIKSLSQLTDSPNLHIALWGSSVTEKGYNELKAALPKAQIRWEASTK
jgi:uncharacterized protein (TIGR03067 family)